MFFGGKIKTSFKFNYNFFSVIYNNNMYINFNKLFFLIKSLLPIFFSVFLTQGKILFIATK